MINDLRPSLRLVRGAPALALLGDQSFLSGWHRLHGLCPHATAYQAPGFVRSWYESYRDVWEPVIVESRDCRGDVDGLWLLAYRPDTRVLAHAGAHQAEYHAWLARPGEDNRFLSAAWAQLADELSFGTLSFKYLPSPALAETLQRALGAASGIVVRREPRPLLRLDAEEIKASFAKKSNRSRINRLKKLGRLEFRRLTEPAELEGVFDELIDCYDFRQSAVNHTAPFRADPCKRDFHSRLFAAGPGETYVTVTLLDERPIAAFWGSASGKTVHLGMLIHSPFLAEHSPGKLHVMQLTEYLLGEGKEVLDLTPGGVWKERFANGGDEVAEVTVYASPWAHRRAAALAGLLRWSKGWAGRAGITPAMVRSAVERFHPTGLRRGIRTWAGFRHEYRLYRSDRSLAEGQCRDERVRCNCLADLLSFAGEASRHSPGAFHSGALARLEQGQSAYSVRLDGRLAHYGWMAPQADRNLPETYPPTALPPGSVAFHDFFSAPDFRQRGLYRATIGHMLHAAFSLEDTRYAYISVPADNLPARHVIEAMGFEYQGSFFRVCRFGVEKTWSATTPQQPMD